MYDGGILAYKLLPGKDVNHGIHGGLEEEEEDDEDESIRDTEKAYNYLITTAERERLLYFAMIWYLRR